MKAEEFDRRFDAGEDVTGDLDLAGLRRQHWSSGGSTLISRRG